MEFHVDGTRPTGPGWVFVFGSNLAAIHGKGAALEAARNWGAHPMISKGMSSRGLCGASYAIPTKDTKLKPLPLSDISNNVSRFISYAIHRNDYANDRFWVTAIGCGFAGYKHSDIAPMFREAPANCSLPDVWKEHLGC